MSVQEELDPVITFLVAHGGLKDTLLGDIWEEMHPTARAIKGLLRKDGMTWLQAARKYYEGERVVTGMGSTEDGSLGTYGFIELVGHALENSFPELPDEPEQLTHHVRQKKAKPDKPVDWYYRREGGAEFWFQFGAPVGVTREKVGGQFHLVDLCSKKKLGAGLAELPAAKAAAAKRSAEHKKGMA